MSRIGDDGLPIDLKSQQPLEPRSQPGYYPGFQTLSQQAFWDAATRKTVLDRVKNIPPIRYFSAEEARLMDAICNRILPQDDRDPLHRIPILNLIDRRLSEGRIDGYRYERMPPDGEAFRLGLQGIEAVAKHLFARPFVELGALEQELVLKTVHDGDPPAGQEIWRQMPVERFWLLLVQDVVGFYYAHPYAWDEIGFGGPAYPRGYMRLENGEPEPWEVKERRYAWAAPPGSPSAKFEHVGEAADHKGSLGQGGTH